MPSNTLYNPKTTAEFTKDHLEFFGQSVFFTCAVSETQHQDLVIADDCLFTGGELLVENGTIEDQVFLQIVHPQAGVLKELVSGYRVAKDTVKQLSLTLEYPAKVFTGLIVRCVYVSGATGETRKIAVNFYTHRILE